MDRFVRSTCLLMFALPYAVVADAQSTAPAVVSPQFSVTARIVVLDIVVTDKHGNTVNDLKAEDFIITEDKALQRIRSFETPLQHVMPSRNTALVQSSADLPKIGDAPVTLLVLDELNTRFEDMAFARDSLEKYLLSQPEILKQPTTLLVASNSRFSSIQDYTQDRSALLTALKNHFPEYPWRMMHSGKQGPGAAERMAQSLASLHQIAQASQGTPGRKNVIWVGRGFPSSDLTGLDDATAATIETAVRRITEALLRSRITLYIIDPSINTTSTIEVETPDDLSSAEDENGGDIFPGTVKFSTLAPATGGRFFVSRNDVDREIATGIDMSADYYTLSYSPSNKSEEAATYRKIRIQMRDPNLHAVTRDGYYPGRTVQSNVAAGPVTPSKQAIALLKMDLSNAALSTMVYNGLAVTADKGDGHTYRISVGAGGLQWKRDATGEELAEVTVLAVALSAKGKVLAHSARELQAVMKSDSSPNPSEKVLFNVPADLPVGTVRLRFVVRDALSGKIGTSEISNP